MADMGVGHEEGTGTDACAAFGVDATVDDDILTDHHIVTDEAVGETTFPAEILRVGSDDGSLIDLAVFAEAGAADDACKGHDDSVVADFHVLVNVGEGMDGDVLADFGRGVDMCFVANHDGWFKGVSRL